MAYTSLPNPGSYFPDADCTTLTLKGVPPQTMLAIRPSRVRSGGYSNQSVMPSSVTCQCATWTPRSRPCTRIDLPQISVDSPTDKDLARVSGPSLLT